MSCVFKSRWRSMASCIRRAIRLLDQQSPDFPATAASAIRKMRPAWRNRSYATVLGIEQAHRVHFRRTGWENIRSNQPRRILTAAYCTGRILRVSAGGSGTSRLSVVAGMPTSRGPRLSSANRQSRQRNSRSIDGADRRRPPAPFAAGITVYRHHQKVIGLSPCLWRNPDSTRRVQAHIATPPRSIAINTASQLMPL